MKRIIIFLFLLSTIIGQAQNAIEWDGIYKLQLSDFQSPSTQIGGVDIYSLQSTCGMDFSFYMSYARKFRKKLYDEKKAFSNVNFFKPSYDEIQKDFVSRHTNAGKETDIGRDSVKLEELHIEVLKEIEQLPDFCKKCKPINKK